MAKQLIVLICISGIWLLAGCKKSGDDTPNVPQGATTVMLISTDMNPDGTLKPAALQKVQQESGATAVLVTFARTRLTDAGLSQLTAFRNVRRVQALGSPLSPEAIDKFKAAIPDAEIVK